MAKPSPRAARPLSRTEFVTRLTGAQWRIYAFIRMLTGDREATDEILQETNVALWEQADRFEAGTSFEAWACRVAWFKVLDYRKAQRRLKMRIDERLLGMLLAESVEADVDIDAFEREKQALAACIDALAERHRMVLSMYYDKGLPLASIGESINRNRNAVAQLLHRIRGTLRACIEKRLAGAAS